MLDDAQLLEGVKGATHSWFMMSSAWSPVGLTALYLVLIKVLAPKFMKHKKPFDLTAILLLYNAALVLFSVGWLVKLVLTRSAVSYILDAVFRPSTFKVNVTIEKQLDELVFYYLMSKYVEFAETVFFTLRQKWSQVSFLHVYHHANMATVTWCYLKYLWGRHIVVIAVANVFIHAIMYTYYLLAAMGPAVRPYLWWKRYLTSLQLAQFVFILTYVGLLVYHGSAVQSSFLWVTAVNTTSFLGLFVSFYINTYCSKDSNKPKQNKSL